MIDEVYVKPQITFKGKNILGIAENLNDCNSIQAATTLQVIMISSLLSNYSDVVGLYPVKRLDAQYSADILEEILVLLHKIGFEVVAITSDNHPVNGKSFKIIGESDFIPLVMENKYSTSTPKKIYFNFDPPHLLKCIRNIFQKSRHLHFPSLENPGSFRMASMSDLEKLFDIERFNTLKLAPQLTHKALHPSNLDKQNVYLALCIFNIKNIEALKFFKTQLGPNVDGTIEFLNIIVNIWNIFNVRSPEKGKHFRNPFMDPITSLANPSIKYLSKVANWLSTWYECVKGDFQSAPFHSEISRVGKLTKETQTALLHTVHCFIDLSKYLLTDAGFNGQFKYVLLGQFSTDKLEYQFSLYRKMSGHNYHVSVRQIIESQKKLNCISSLKLFKKNTSSVSIKEFLNEFSFEDTSIFPVEDIDAILDLAEDMNITAADINVIIYVAGYVSRKTYERFQCNFCKNILISGEEEMVVEFSIETEYLQGLSHGGLKYPSDISTEIGIRGLKIFRAVTSENFETQFMKSKNHKNILYSIFSEYTESLAYDLPVDFPCSHSASKLINFCVNSWINIFLNNYTKELNDTTYQSISGSSTINSSNLTKRRKLNTFTNSSNSGFSNENSWFSSDISD